jgi:hypothetical protein
MTYNIKSWKINTIFDNDSTYHNILLDQAISIYNYDNLKTKNRTLFLNTNQNELSLIEKYIYDIAMFHFNRLNITFDPNTHYIEFWIRNDAITHFHLDKDEYNYEENDILITPLLSCITYLNDNTEKKSEQNINPFYWYPTIITNVTDDDVYNYHNNPNFHKNDCSICYSFPQKMKHICFNGGKYYHTSFNVFNDDNEINDRFILAVNLWNTKCASVRYFNKNDITDKLKLFNSVQIKKKYQLLSFLNKIFKNNIYKTKELNTEFFKYLITSNKSEQYKLFRKFTNILQNNNINDDIVIFENI